MATWATLPADLLWRHALAAIPLGLLVAALTRWLPMRAPTRHILWLTVLLWLIVAPLLPQAPTITIPTVAAKNPASYPESISRTDTPTRIDPPPEIKIKPAVAADASGLAARDWDSARGTLWAQRGDVPPAGSGASKRLARASRPDGPQHRTAGESYDSAESDGSDVVSHDPAPDASGTVAAPALGHASIPPEDAELPRLLSRPLMPDALSSWPRASEAGTSFAQVDGLGLSGAYNPSSTSVAAEASDTSTSVVAAETSDELKPREAESTPQVATATGPDPAVTNSVQRLIAWSIALVGVRDAIGNVPPLPSSVWIGGALVAGLIALVRILGMQRLVNSASPAPRPVREMVAEAARAMEMRSVPDAMMVERCISPMVCAGRRARLLLPVALWSQLDEAGRRAVVFHEMAHLRRRDHWVSWAETIVGLVYWWHPLVWWVRSRVRAEAELSCDAWVTWLLPHGRRAYAKALLSAKQYIRDESSWMPVYGMGATTGRAGRFARRLTMVMTGSSRPRLSGSGIALVLIVALTGWIATPAQSCPPKKDCAKTSTITITKDAEFVVAGVGCGDCKGGKPCKQCARSVSIVRSGKNAGCVCGNKGKSCGKSCKSAAKCCCGKSCKSAGKGFGCDKPCVANVLTTVLAPKLASTFERYLDKRAPEPTALAPAYALFTEATAPTVGITSFSAPALSWASPALLFTTAMSDDDDDDDDDLQRRLDRLEKMIAVLMSRLGDRGDLMFGAEDTGHYVMKAKKAKKARRAKKARQTRVERRAVERTERKVDSLVRTSVCAGV